MERRIKPWVNKKIVEYIGEEEPTLTDFICQKVMAHSTPQTILDDVAMVSWTNVAAHTRCCANVGICWASIADQYHTNLVQRLLFLVV